MSWNYRIVKYADGTGYGLHEVYYNVVGQPMAMSEHTAGFVGETVPEVHSAMMMARRDAVGRPVLDAPAEWRRKQ